MAADPPCRLRLPITSVLRHMGSGGLRKFDVEGTRATASRNPTTLSSYGGGAVADLERAIDDGVGDVCRANEILRARAARGRPERVACSYGNVGREDIARGSDRGIVYVGPAPLRSQMRAAARGRSARLHEERIGAGWEATSLGPKPRGARGDRVHRA